MKTATATATAIDAPRIFLTDYASYNEGTQFEFGHWVELNQFENSEELLEYINNHFEEADKKSPLPCGTPREETMITDYENFPSQFYGESMATSDWDKLFSYLEIADTLENYDEQDWVNLHNEFCQNTSRGEDEIFNFDDDFFELFFWNDPMKAAQCTHFGDVNWSDDFITFNGYGNLKSLDSYELEKTISKDEIIEAVLEEPENYNL